MMRGSLEDKKTIDITDNRQEEEEEEIEARKTVLIINEGTS